MKQYEKLVYMQPSQIMQCFLVAALLLLCTGALVFAQTAEQIAEKALAATVSLEMKTGDGTIIGYGSGFFAAEDRIATNFHVIEGATKGTAKLVANEHNYYNIEGVLATDKDNDLALLKVSVPGSKPLPLGDSDDVKIGMTVYVTGNPKGLKGTFSNGIISNLRDRNMKKRLQMTAPISSGSSGGPVLNGKGEVVGVSYMTIVGGQNLNFAIPSNYLKELIVQSGRVQSFAQWNRSIKEVLTKGMLSAAVDAHGGLEKLQSVKNIVVEGRATANSPMGQMNLDVKGYQVYPDKLRQDIKMPQGEMSYAFDGTSGFALTPMGPQPLPPEMTASLKDGIFREPIWLLASLMKGDNSVQYAGTEEVMGNTAAIVLVPQPSGEVLRVFISEETHYIVKMGFRETEQGVVVNKETLLGDYRDVEGVKVPHHIQQNVEGELFTETRLSSVMLNADLDDSLFQEPK